MKNFHLQEAPGTNNEYNKIMGGFRESAFSICLW